MVIMHRDGSPSKMVWNKVLSTICVTEEHAFRPKCSVNDGNAEPNRNRIKFPFRQSIPSETTGLIFYVDLWHRIFLENQIIFQLESNQQIRLNQRVNTNVHKHELKIEVGLTVPVPECASIFSSTQYPEVKVITLARKSSLCYKIQNGRAWIWNHIVSIYPNYNPAPVGISILLCYAMERSVIQYGARVERCDICVYLSVRRHVTYIKLCYIQFLIRINGANILSFALFFVVLFMLPRQDNLIACGTFLF